MSTYNPNARTPEEHLTNCRFQLENVAGYLEMAADFKKPAHRHAAAIKANCLLESAQLLVAAFEAEMRVNLQSGKRKAETGGVA